MSEGKLKMLDLFSGIGGFSLAASWTGKIETVAFCEIDIFPQKVLKKHWPNVPIFEDVRTLTNEALNERGIERVDIITGGFPCQPFSCAGKQRGKDDDRFIWPEMFRIISEVRPTWVIGENVNAFIGMALDDVLLDLERGGYEAQTFVIPACAINAPHKRDRVWIVARNSHGDIEGTNREICYREDTKPSGSVLDVANSEGLRGRGWSDPGAERWRGLVSDKQEGREIRREIEGCGNITGTVNADPDSAGIQGSENTRGVSPCGGSSPQHAFGLYTTGEYWLTEPTVGRVANGISNRVDRLKGLGNSIVPQVAYQILQAISDIALEANP